MKIFKKMNWRSLKIWIPVVLISGSLIYLPSIFSSKQYSIKSPRMDDKVEGDRSLKKLPPYMRVPLAPPPPFPVEPKTDYLDLFTKLGGVLGVFMTVLNLTEKVVKLFRKDKKKGE